MLEPEEFQQIRPILIEEIREIKEFRRSTGSGLHSQVFPTRGLKMYQCLTGTTLESSGQIWEAQLSLYGALCPACSKPFRTPRAHFCAECGYTLPDGEVAGPLERAAIGPANSAGE
ncbi:hypothetical protein [Maricaulis sp.]|uniref:hypothetical protein n=1 Tax=Maricaulis sp. TaxID=1486257 RepID=UPI003A8E8FAD